MSNSKISLASFLELVELKTKVASFFPMMIGFFWSLAHYQKFNFLNAFLFFVAVLSFDMCTTAINNAMDYQKAHDNTYKQHDNIIGKDQLDYRLVIKIIFGLLGCAIAFSLILVSQTDLLLLPIGALCFLIGIFYTYGPLPLSRLPLGEIFSGVTMGFGIFFLAIFIHQPQHFLSSQWSAGHVVLSFFWWETLKIFFMSLPLVCLIANIMLANNICDYEQDIKNKRFTLVHYIGPSKALLLYQTLSLTPWLLWLCYIVFNILPLWSSIGCLVLIPYLKSLKRFSKTQIKQKTFIESIRGFLLFSTLYLVVAFILTIISLFK